MKTFEEIYADTVKQLNCNYGEEFAKAMFNAGKDVNLAQNLEEAAKDSNFFITLLSYVMQLLAKRACETNASEICMSTRIKVDGTYYKTYLSSVTFDDGDKSFEDRAAEIAEHILSSTPICDFKDVLIKAILAGFDLRKEYFEED